MERLTILTTPSKGDGVRIQVEKMVEQKSKEFNLLLKQLPHVDTAISQLISGNADLVAMSALDWRNVAEEDLIISAILPRREPTWVLVCDDKPEYLIPNARIICDSKLIRRQLSRLRNNLDIMPSKQLISDLKITDEMDDIDLISWLEECRQNQLIDGFVTTRSLHSSLKFKSRRHTLGLQRENPERTHFIPPPLHGFTLLVSRKGFPASSIASMNDESALICHKIESGLFDSLDEKIKHITGIYVEQRKIGTILREAKKSNDDSTIESVIGKDGKPSDSNIRLQLTIETLSHDGKVTAMCERIIPIEKSHMGMVNLLKEFNSLVKLMEEERQESSRIIPGLPESYNEAKDPLLNLEDYSDSTRLETS